MAIKRMVEINYLLQLFYFIEYNKQGLPQSRILLCPHSLQETESLLGLATGSFSTRSSQNRPSHGNSHVYHLKTA